MPQINPVLTGGGMVFATPVELITKALKDIGVVGFGRSASAAEITDGLMTLNTLLDMWSVMRENINVRKTDILTLVINQYDYQIGVGSTDFDTVRPIKIEEAYYTNNGTDFPISCDMNEHDYSLIPIKGLSGNPSRLLYRPDFPYGNILLDYAPSVAWTFTIKSWKPFSKILDPNDITAISYPDGFESAILFNLEELLCAPNKKEVPAVVSKMALLSLQAIQSAYGETPVVKNWDLPGVQRRRPTFFDMGGGE